MEETIIDEALAKAKPSDEIELFSEHALDRMRERGISIESVFQAMSFGRIYYRRGATIYVIGKKELVRYERDGVDLRKHEGIHVLTSREGEVITVCRNRSLSWLRPRKRMPRRWLKANRRRQMKRDIDWVFSASTYKAEPTQTPC